MTRSSTPSKKRNTNPTRLAPGEREYYRATWGFDPVVACKAVRENYRRYEACFPLSSDPPLEAAGVTICARVDWRGEGIYNRIVFRRGGAGGGTPQEAAVECTHTVVYAGPADDALNFATDAYTTENYLTEVERKMVRRAGGLVTLPPWEHYVALKSYVTAIAEMGILAILRHSFNSAAESADQLPFGFNTAFRNQIMQALREIAPSAMEYFLQNFTAELIENSPPSFVISRWELLNDEPIRISAHLARPDFFAPWLQRWLASRDPRGTTPETGEGLLVPGEVARDLTGPLVGYWKDLVHVLQPALITRLFRYSNLFDGLQDHLFGTPRADDAGRECVPEVPWEELHLEWQARQAIRKHVDNLDIENERALNPEEILPAEVYPRGFFCETPLLTPFPARFPDLNTRAMARRRLVDLGSELSKEGEEWILVKYHPLLREEMDEEYQRQMTLARDPKTTPKILENLARTEEDDVRQLVSVHPATPSSALELLSNSQDSFVKLAVIAHPSTTVSVREKLLHDEEICERLAPLLTHRGRLQYTRAQPHQLYIFSSEEGQKAAKRLLATYTQMPDFILELFAKDEDPSIREAVAGNISTRPAIPKHLSEEKESIVGKRVTKNLTAPVDVIERLRGDINADIREAAINHPVSLPAQISGTPEHVNEVAQKMSQLGAHMTRTLVKKTKDPKLLNSLVYHWDLPTRLALAVNPEVSQEILEVMTQDVQPSVRAIANARLRRPGKIIDPIPGEILTIGEILWLLVSHEGKEIAFFADQRGDYSPTYTAWITSFRGRNKPPNRFQTYRYEVGIIRDNWERDSYKYIHLALDGLRDLIIGRWPCMFMLKF